MSTRVLVAVFLIAFVISCDSEDEQRIAGPAIDFAPSLWLDEENLIATAEVGDIVMMWMVISAPAGLRSMTFIKRGGEEDPNFPREFHEERVPGVIQSFFSYETKESEIGESVTFTFEAEDEVGQKSSLDVRLVTTSP